MILDTGFWILDACRELNAKRGPVEKQSDHESTKTLSSFVLSFFRVFVVSF
jgi:hypothetical protein